MKIRLVGDALLHVETDLTKLMVALRTNAKAPKIIFAKAAYFRISITIRHLLSLYYVYDTSLKPPHNFACQTCY